MSSPRFAILEHLRDGVHWDLLLEQGGYLRTWALEELPAAGRPIKARQLPPHRLMYLDYQGPIPGGRGTVRRVAEGTYDSISWTASRVEVVLRGDRLTGRLLLELDQESGREPALGERGWTIRLGNVD